MIDLFSRQSREWSIHDVAKLIRRHERFSMLNEADGVVLVQHMHPLRLSAGQALFTEGRNDANFMAVILEGTAKVETEGGGLGERVLLANLKEGDLVGEQGILQETRRSATITATSDLMVAAIDSGKFDRLVKAKPSIGVTILMSLLRTVTLRMWEVNQRLHILEHENKHLKKELVLEIASRPKTVLKDIPPLDFSPSMFEPPDPKQGRG